MDKMKKCKGCGAEIHKSAKICPHCGKKNKKHTGLIILGIIVVCIAVGVVRGKVKDHNEKMVQYKWPTSGVAALLPDPEMKYGKIWSESEDYFSIDLYFVKESEFSDYVEACKDAGFTKDYESSSTHYDAKDKKGNGLSIWYNDTDEQMNVNISSKSKLKEDAEADSQLSDTAEEESAKSTTSTAKKSTKKKKTSEKRDTAEKKNVKFREWVDEYEECMNEYVDFMKNYDPNDVSQVTEYAELYGKYADFLEATDKLEEDDYSVSDWAYYMRAQGRVMDKLSEIE